jgi:hypothetical protein
MEYGVWSMEYGVWSIEYGSMITLSTSKIGTLHLHLHLYIQYESGKVPKTQTLSCLPGNCPTKHASTWYNKYLYERGEYSVFVLLYCSTNKSCHQYEQILSPVQE